MLVDDEDIKSSIRILLEHTSNLAEGAGAAAMAAVIKYPELFKGKKTAVIMSGGNLSVDKFKQIFKDYTQS